MASDLTFQPNQIVCIEMPPTWLFGEVVQHVTTRHQCWVRPLVLATQKHRTARLETIGHDGWEWYDLRPGSDLLLPEQLFREALDLEVLPLMSLLFQAEDKAQGENDRDTIARQQLHAFVRQVCQSKPQAFRGIES
jgi:hypothetical protein